MFWFLPGESNANLLNNIKRSSSKKEIVFCFNIFMYQTRLSGNTTPVKVWLVYFQHVRVPNGHFCFSYWIPCKEIVLIPWMLILYTYCICAVFLQYFFESNSILNLLINCWRLRDKWCIYRQFNLQLRPPVVSNSFSSATIFSKIPIMFPSQINIFGTSCEWPSPISSSNHF